MGIKLCDSYHYRMLNIRVQLVDPLLKKENYSMTKMDVCLNQVSVLISLLCVLETLGVTHSDLS